MTDKIARKDVGMEHPIKDAQIPLQLLALVPRIASSRYQKAPAQNWGPFDVVILSEILHMGGPYKLSHT